MTRKPDPLPDKRAVFVLPDGTPSPDLYRWLMAVDSALKATIDVIDAPAPPDPEIEFPEQWPYGVALPKNGDYVIIQNNDVERTITATVSDADSGTCTATFKINTTPLGGTANGVSSAEQVRTHSSANVLGVGDDLVVTISSNSACEKMRLNVKTTRTIVIS